MRRTLMGSVLTLLTTSCHSPEPTVDPIESAKFGVLFGGQIQERTRLPFELDPARQEQGFRVKLREAPTTARVITWEITRPPSSTRGSERVTELGRGVFSAGQRVFEKSIPFQPGDPLGLWNIRVVLDQRVLIDRPFQVYDKAASPSVDDGGPTIP